MAPPATLIGLTQEAWAETAVDFHLGGRPGAHQVDEVRFLLPRGAELLVDDVLVFEPGDETIKKTSMQ